MRKIIIYFSLLTLLSGCTQDPASEIAAGVPLENTVILISIDGLRSDYIDWYETPNMDRLIADGAHANEGMKPVYPSKTFPNHYSIVTGLYPSNHGIVSNSMYDDEMDDTFAISDREAIENPQWWSEGEPIWTAVQKQGGHSATYFWVGSETPFDGIRPDFWYPYDGSVPAEDRVDQVLTWLDMPENERPRFISAYFSSVDGAGHAYGPENELTGQAVTEIDTVIGRLIAGLEDRDIYNSVNIIIVADHGMSQLSPERVIALDEYINLDDLVHIDGSPVIGLHPVDGRTEAVFNALNNAHPNMHVYLKEDFPERFHYFGNNRIPGIIGYIDDGWSLARTREFADQNPNRYTGGTHGYDNELESMRATFIAHGPAFRHGVTIAPFLNIEIYNAMASIMKIEPSPNDGTAGALSSIME